MELLYSNDTTGRRDFAMMVTALQEAGAKFQVCQDRGFLVITIISGHQ